MRPGELKWIASFLVLMYIVISLRRQNWLWFKHGVTFAVAAALFIAMVALFYVIESKSKRVVSPEPRRSGFLWENRSDWGIARMTRDAFHILDYQRKIIWEIPFANVRSIYIASWGSKAAPSDDYNQKAAFALTEEQAGAYERFWTGKASDAPKDKARWPVVRDVKDPSALVAALRESGFSERRISTGPNDFLLAFRYRTHKPVSGIEPVLRSLAKGNGATAIGLVALAISIPLMTVTMYAVYRGILEPKNVGYVYFPFAALICVQSILWLVRNSRLAATAEVRRIGT